MKFVAYYRISEKYGLALNVQRSSVLRHVAQEGGKLIKEFSEPVANLADVGGVFDSAVQQCRRDKAVLVLAESDPLSRQLNMLARLLTQHVPLAAAGHVDANRILAPLFIATRPDASSEITKPKANKKSSRSHSIGNPDLARARVTSVEVRKKKADVFALEYHRKVLDWRAAGNTLAEIATRLNDMNLVGPRGGRWHSTSVSNLISRCRLLVEPHDESGTA